MKKINTGFKAPLEMADNEKEIARNETQATRVVDYIYNVYGIDFCKKLVEMDTYTCGNKLNSIGFLAVEPQLFKNKLESNLNPLGSRFADFCRTTYGANGSHSRLNDITATGWVIRDRDCRPTLLDDQLMYIVDGRAMHKNIFEQYGNWDNFLKQTQQ